MLKFYSVSIEERETLTNTNYAAKTFNIYTTRPASMKKLIKVLGEPKTISKRDEKIDSMEWDISFDNRKKIKKALTLGVLLPPRKKTDN